MESTAESPSETAAQTQAQREESRMRGSNTQLTGTPGKLHRQNQREATPHQHGSIFQNQRKACPQHKEFKSQAEFKGKSSTYLPFSKRKRKI